MHVWLAGSHLVTLGLPLAALLGTGAFAADLHAQTLQDAEHQGVAVAELAAELLATTGSDDVADVAGRLSPRLVAVKERTLAGFQVVDRRGRVVAGSAAASGQDLGDMPEVREALAGRVGVATRPRRVDPATPLGSESRRAGYRIFVAVPIEVRGAVLGSVVVSRTPREELQTLWQMLPAGLLLGGLGAMGGAVALALAAGSAVTRSLRGIAAESAQIAGGTVSRARLEGPRASRVAEVADVAAAIGALVDRLQERMSYIADFAGNVSHEFRTPLTTLRGTLELLEDEPDMEAAQRGRFLENARAEVDRLEAMVAGILALARIDERAAAGEPVDLDALLRDVAERRDVAFEPGAGEVTGDSAQLAAAAENLVGNALRHGARPVVVRGWRRDGRPGFEVQDAGPGISPANRARVFQRFFTTDRERGTGLGLALVAAVAEAHGGSVDVESEPGRTVFRVTVGTGNNQ